MCRLTVTFDPEGGAWDRVVRFRPGGQRQDSLGHEHVVDCDNPWRVTTHGVTGNFEQQHDHRHHGEFYCCSAARAVRTSCEIQRATAIEYALIAAGVGVAIITSVNALGTAISSKFNTVKTALK